MKYLTATMTAAVLFSQTVVDVDAEVAAMVEGSRLQPTTEAAVFQAQAIPTLWDVISDADRECMAMNIYHEARSETIFGQIAVAQVTLNRMFMDRYPDTICGVVWQNKQFSWTHDGLSDTPKELGAWATSKAIAQLVLETWDTEVDVTFGADHYHADSVSPFWSNQDKLTTVIGDHIFYDLY